MYKEYSHILFSWHVDVLSNGERFCLPLEKEVVKNLLLCGFRCGHAQCAVKFQQIKTRQTYLRSFPGSCGSWFFRYANKIVVNNDIGELTMRFLLILRYLQACWGSQEVCHCCVCWAFLASLMVSIQFILL